MKLLARLLFVCLAGGLWMGCSDSTAYQPSYPLTLTVDSLNESSPINYVFTLRVTKNGVPISGATLEQTDDPTGAMFNPLTKGMTSDSVGVFPDVTIGVNDTLSRVAFQAIKDTVVNNVKDTLLSNFILWPAE